MRTRKLVGLLMVLMFLACFMAASRAEAEWVKGYFRSNGTYVQPYQRSNPDGNPYNNYSYPGNYNPNTGQITTGNPHLS